MPEETVKKSRSINTHVFWPSVMLRLSGESVFVISDRVAELVDWGISNTVNACVQESVQWAARNEWMVDPR